MSYRDDRDALRERAEALERELGEARSTIALLTGRVAAPTLGMPKRSALLGVPLVAIIERRFEVRVDEETLEEVAAILRRRVGGVTRTGRVLHAMGIVVDARRDRTHVRAAIDQRAMPIAALSCTGLLGGTLGIAVFGALATLLRGLPERHYLWIAAVTMLVVWPGVRWLAQRIALRSEANVRGAFETVVLVLSEVGASPRARIASTDADADSQADAEMAADAELAPEDRARRLRDS